MIGDVKRNWMLFTRAILMFTIAITSLGSEAGAVGAPGNSAASCIMMEADTGTVLYEKDADKRMLIASTTKIMTALLVLENSNLDEKVAIGTDFPPVHGSSMYLVPGEVLSVSELLHGLLLASGNDAAVALAIYISGSVEKFSVLMNKRAQTIGCTGTHFSNPHGLDAPDHYSTARDLARITCAAMMNRDFQKIASTKNIAFGTRWLRNHNRLLWLCPGALGVKTGYTESAGRSLVSCVERKEMRLICVTLSAPDDWDDHMRLYDWAYATFECVRIKSDAIELPVISGKAASVILRPASCFTGIFLADNNIEKVVYYPAFVYAPLYKGQKIGTVLLIEDGTVLYSTALVVEDTIPLDPTMSLNFWERLMWELKQATVCVVA